MGTFDFSLLQDDLVELENKLRRYGSKPVRDEVSLNQLFVDHSKNYAVAYIHSKFHHLQLSLLLVHLVEH